VQAIIDNTGSNWMGFPFLFALCAAASLTIWFAVDVDKGACLCLLVLGDLPCCALCDGGADVGADRAAGCDSLGDREPGGRRGDVRRRAGERRRGGLQGGLMTNDASDGITTSNTTVSFCGLSHKCLVYLGYDGKKTKEFPLDNRGDRTHNLGL
jgi:hypothetical protein